MQLLYFRDLLFAENAPGFLLEGTNYQASAHSYAAMDKPVR